jgi:acyl dehydratase
MLKTAANPKTIRGTAELSAAVGEELGISPWYDVSQDRITAFADATGDRYWIHVDPERAAASGKGSTIAHGLFTLSLGPQLMDTIVSFEGFDGKLNYGYERVRFPGPVPVDTRLRMRLTVIDVDEGPGSIRVRLQQTFERENEPKPACVATCILRLETRADG